MTNPELKEDEIERSPKKSRPPFFLPPQDGTLQVSMQAQHDQEFVLEQQRAHARNKRPNGAADPNSHEHPTTPVAVSTPTHSVIFEHAQQAQAREAYLETLNPSPSRLLQSGISPVAPAYSASSVQLAASTPEASHESGWVRAGRTTWLVTKTAFSVLKWSTVTAFNLVGDTARGVWGGLTWLANWDHLKMVGHGLWRAGETIGQMVGFLFSENFRNALGMVGHMAWELLKSPTTWRTAYHVLLAGLNGIKDVALMLGHDPKRALGMMWNGIKFVSDAIGLTGILDGGFHLLLKTPYTLLTGFGRSAWQLSQDFAAVLSGRLSPEALAQRLEQNLRKTFEATGKDLLRGLGLFTAGGKALLEFTGLWDAGACIYYLAKGNKGLALMYGISAAMSIGAIVATVATAGSLAGTMVGWALVRQGAKRAFLEMTKEAFEVAGKRMARVLIGGLMEQQFSCSALQHLAGEMSDKLAQRAGKHAIQHGLASLGVKEVRKFGVEIGSHEMLAYLRSRVFREGLDKHVEKLTLDLLTRVNHKNRKELAKYFMEMGFEDPKVAKRMADASWAVLRRGKKDKELRKALTESITTELMAHIRSEAKEPFMAAFARNVWGQGNSQEAHALAAATMQRALRTFRATIEHTDPLYKRLARYEKLLENTNNYDKVARMIGKMEQLEDQRLFKAFKKTADDYVHAGWEGVEEGMEKAVRKLVDRGVKKAFKKFREAQKGHFRLRHKPDERKRSLLHDGEDGPDEPEPLVVHDSHGANVHFGSDAADRYVVEFKQTVDGVVMVTKEVHPDGRADVVGERLFAQQRVAFMQLAEESKAAVREVKLKRVA